MAKQNEASDASQNSDDTTTLKQLQSQLSQTQTDLANTSAALQDTKQQLASVTADRDTLAAANAKLEQENNQQAADLVEAEALIEQQTAQLKAAEVSQAHGPVVVTHEKEQYRVLAPKFSHKGLEVEASQLRSNPDLVRELVEAGSGLLVKVGAAS